MAVFHVTGDDEALVHRAVSDLVHRLVGSEDRAMMVDDFDGDDVELRAVVDAAQTPPFLTERRVVIARDIGRFPVEEMNGLIAYLADPLPTTDLVLVGGGRLPKPLGEAIKSAGAEVVSTTPPSRARERSGWFDEHIAASGLKLDAPARALLGSWLGEDAGRLAGILDTLLATFGRQHTLHVADVTPFLGERGGVPPWDLTDAIDRGDTSAALSVLQRMMGAGERHPLQVMAILHGHFARMLALDGSDADDEASAAAAMGIKPGFPAKKALQQYQRLGGGGVSRAIALLAQADLDLRGAKEWPDDLVMELLVARLSRLR